MIRPIPAIECSLSCVWCEAAGGIVVSEPHRGSVPVAARLPVTGLVFDTGSATGPSDPPVPAGFVVLVCCVSESLLFEQPPIAMAAARATAAVTPNRLSLLRMICLSILLPTSGRASPDERPLPCLSSPEHAGEERPLPDLSEAKDAESAPACESLPVRERHFSFVRISRSRPGGIARGGSRSSRQRTDCRSRYSLCRDPH